MRRTNGENASERDRAQVDSEASPGLVPPAPNARRSRDVESSYPRALVVLAVSSCILFFLGGAMGGIEGGGLAMGISLLSAALGVAALIVAIYTKLRPGQK